MLPLIDQEIQQHPMAIFNDDICFEVMSWLDSEFIIKNCFFISKQWINVAITRVKFSFDLSQQIIGKMQRVIECMTSSQYIHNLTSLDLSGNQIDFEGAKYVSSNQFLHSLTALYLGSNIIGDEG